MTYRYLDASRKSDPHSLPDVEVFHAARDLQGDVIQTAGHPNVHEMNGLEQGWFFAFGQPGCLWDGDPEGPYADADAAMAGAREAGGFCEHGHDLDDRHPCNDCAVERADAMGDRLRDEGL